MGNEDLKRDKLAREIEEEVRRLKTYFDYLEQDDLDEIAKSLSKMFDIGFYYAISKTYKETESSKN